MTKTVYDVREIQVETRNGEGAQDKLLNSTGYDTYLIRRFDNLSEAVSLYNELETRVKRMGSYYLHECKLLEMNILDDDGKFVDGDWIFCDFPENG